MALGNFQSFSSIPTNFSVVTKIQWVTALPSRKSAIIRESNHGSGVCKVHYA